MESNKKNGDLLSFENKDIVFIKPSKATPSILLSLSSIDNYMMGFFAQSLYVYRSLLENPNSPADADGNATNTINPTTKRDPAKVITKALSKALFYYYPLAGKLVKHGDGKLRINCTSDGVPFQEVICNCNLSSLNYLDNDDVEIAKHFGIDFPFEDEHGNQYLMALKLTKFLCGGFICAWGVNHAVIDGTGKVQFLVALSELAAGESEPSVKPVWERERLVGKITSHPLQNPIHNAAVSPLMPTTDLSHACFRVNKESIASLKRSLVKDIDHSSVALKKTFTTFECLAAYIWRARARALKLNEDGETMLLIIVGLRPRLEDPLPSGYYGNGVIDAYVKLTVKQLNEQPLFEVVKRIRDVLIASSSNDYITNYIDTIETKPLIWDFDYEKGGITVLTDWRNLGCFEKIDFGWKEAVNMVPVPCKVGVEDMYDIMPPTKLDPSMSAGLRFFTSLPPAAMPKFKEEMKLLMSNNVPTIKFQSYL
ncbi:hypothetical protein VNO78_12941 [Psophocarpus tetragonolobus]|uniref:Uncharacterized protein n=1 Tax=Psophocarpus tetragonolobus TaxID=3891 RepID=A0AAN9SPR9_PSOTE